MRVTESTEGSIQVEDGVGRLTMAALMGGALVLVGVALCCLGLGTVQMPFVVGGIGGLAVAAGLAVALTFRERRSVFDRAGGIVTLSTRGLLGERRRDVPLEDVSDLLVKRNRGARVETWGLYLQRKDHSEALLGVRAGPREGVEEIRQEIQRFLQGRAG